MPPEIPAAGTETPIHGHLVVHPGTEREIFVALVDRVFVGRECAGVDDRHRIVLVDDLAVSRNHLEVRVEAVTSTVHVIDTSSNGTRVNGVKIERSSAIQLGDGDRIHVGSHLIEFRSATIVRGPQRPAAKSTVSVDAPTVMAMVMGDLIGFSTVSELADQQVIARDVDRLYLELRRLLADHRGTLVDYVGDAFFASWEIEADPNAVDNALKFVLAASERIPEFAATLELKNADGTPLRMGWGVSMGTVAMRLMPGAVVMVIGDAVNVGFRVSSIAGREGRPDILVTEPVREAAGEAFAFSEPETVPVKGRVGEVTMYGLAAAPS